jgi:hypothetical protein
MAKNTFERTVDFILNNPDKNGKISSYDAEIVSMSIDHIEKDTEYERNKWASIDSMLMQITEWDGVEHNISPLEHNDYVFLTMPDIIIAQTKK